MSIDFTPHAVYDIDTASEYLEAEKAGGGGRFRADLTQLLAQLELLPEAADLHDPPNPRHPGLRFRQLPVFWHYAVYYRPVPDGILVVRVLHTSRNVAAIFAPDPDPPA
ncbi:Plasmid stabilization system protein OS=Singulisphaera acidiphila (strain ATCC BAA-1392 / DSM 18658 / VKM B-2454 / MOB10) GN=Sinac_3255 PE=4 SV=1: Plasmid_stabil [Gemmataceae bacterium]|nr:Plasmid stabilization system protein OS=Singulisphaera acidiphila (strain ATCC BAA-1392 / DSM 18658 / VKM B-2454 / MOB10) GN=Sinac_3255 PE=4 SV=1: Plasmid_stabil [Gemmataceae bacterium]VTU02302.1 Plasmid stabilization system protein OS=Singulisphaera acidiphila (strain ATCC BAA-1392 / DSM 18658 / VKM B-2454 / MOB10) GN=Sinac_3255 PE=4 SV=1: Plasmid_stabil [Gemmataceae bacterium]